MVSGGNNQLGRLAIEEKVTPLLFIKGRGVPADSEETIVVSRKQKQLVKILNNLSTNFVVAEMTRPPQFAKTI